MKLFTINATPVQSKEQYMEQLGAAMPSDKVLNDTEVEKFNEIAIREYPKNVAELLAKHGVDGFTIYQVQGYWRGTPEVSFKIEVATDDSSTIDYVARELRDMFNQESVMVTLPDNTVEFV